MELSAQLSGIAGSESAVFEVDFIDTKKAQLEFSDTNTRADVSIYRADGAAHPARARAMGLEGARWSLWPMGGTARVVQPINANPTFPVAHPARVKPRSHASIKHSRFVKPAWQIYCCRMEICAPSARGKLWLNMCRIFGLSVASFCFLA